VQAKPLAADGCGDLVAVAAVDGVLVAFACAQSYQSFCYDTLQAEITEMYVQPAFRRQGIAAALIALLEKLLFERGASEVKILTGTHNADAHRVYTNSGYALINEVVFQKKI
jgi:GNAT superfamily N-acetyltransferase